MRKIAIATVVVILFQITVPLCSAERPAKSGFISVSFVIDGKPAECNDAAIRLQFRGQTIVPQFSENGFVVPTVFERKPSDWPEKDKVGIYFTCGEYVLDFEEHPSWVSPGTWEFGIEYPTHWVHLGYTELENGMWVSSLTAECNDCDPGVVSLITHPNPPPSIPSYLLQEQPTASGGRARDIAYALAVFNVNYQQNRDYLMTLLGGCLSRPKGTAENDICDGALLNYVANLYWRGDSDLLQPLLQFAESRKDVIDNIGTFYANLLDRRTAITLTQMQQLPVEKQEIVCRLAGEFELWYDSQKLARVSANLHSENTEVATRCLQEVKAAVMRASVKTDNGL